MRQPTGRIVGTVQLLRVWPGLQTRNAVRLPMRIVYLHDSSRNRGNLDQWCRTHGLHLDRHPDTGEPIPAQTDRNPGDTDEPTQTVSPPPVNTDNRAGPRWAAYAVAGLEADLAELCGRPFVRDWHYPLDCGVPRPQRPSQFAPKWRKGK